MRSRRNCHARLALQGRIVVDIIAAPFRRRSACAGHTKTDMTGLRARTGVVTGRFRAPLFDIVDQKEGMRGRRSPGDGIVWCQIRSPTRTCILDVFDYARLCWELSSAL